MKMEYKAGDLSKLLASTSPKATTPSSKSTPGKNVFSEKKNKKAGKGLNKSFAKGETDTPKGKMVSPKGNAKLGDGPGSAKAETKGSNKKGSHKKKSNVITEDSGDKKIKQARKSIADNFSPSGKKGKQDVVKKNSDKEKAKSEGSPEKPGKKNKKNRKSFGFYRRLERKKEEKQKNSKGKKAADKEEETKPDSSSPTAQKIKQDDTEKNKAQLSKNRKRKNKSSSAGPEPKEKKVKVEDDLESDSESDDNDSDSSDCASLADDSDVNEKGNVKTKLVKSENVASDESSDSDGEEEGTDDEDDDDEDDSSDSDEESEDDLSYKQDASMIDEEKALDSGSNDDSDNDDDDDDDSSESSETEKAPKGGSSSGFCPPEGIVHESLKKTGEKRKPDSDRSDEDTVPTKKMKSDDAETDKGTRPRKDRLAKATNDRTIFVGNLPNSTKKKELERLFKKFGEIESTRFRNVPVNDPKLPKRAIAITRDFHPQRSNFNGYVCFKEAESAKKALSMNATEVDGLHIRVDVVGRQTQKDPKKSVFVGNLPLDIEEEAVRKHFEDCGEIENVRVVRDKKISLGKGFGFVTFKESDGVSFALKLMESKLNGRKLRVEKCGEGKKTKKKANKAAKGKQQNNKTSQEDDGSPLLQSELKKKKKKKKNKVTPSNVSKNPFQEEKDQSDMMKQKAKREKAEKKLQSNNALKNDIEKVLTEGKVTEKNKEDVKQTPKQKKFGDKSFNKQQSGDLGQNKGDNFTPKPKKLGDGFNKQKSGDFGKNKGGSQTPKHKKFGEDDASSTNSAKKFESKGGFQKKGVNKFDNKNFNKGQKTPNKSFETKGSNFGKDGNSGFKKFEKKPFSKGPNTPNKSFEKKPFSKGPNLPNKSFEKKPFSKGPNTPNKSFEKKPFFKGQNTPNKPFEKKPFSKGPNTPNKSFEKKPFHKGPNTPNKPFEKKPFHKGPNTPNKPFEKKGGNFGTKPGFSTKNFDSPAITGSGGKGKHVKFD